MPGAARRWLCGALAALMVLAPGSAAPAQTVHEFYAGKTVAIITSTGPGGVYDLAARTIGRHMTRHLPGSPTFIVRNMPGGGHTLATNYMYTQAPRDGTTLATVLNTIPLQQAIGSPGVRFDAARFNWIGTTGISNIAIGVWHTTGVRSIEDARQREVVMGATGAGAANQFYPLALNQLLGTRFKVVTGYKSAAEIDLALIRGEVQGNGGTSFAGLQALQPEWFTRKQFVTIAQVGAVREPELPDVPLLQDLARDPEQRRLLDLISTPTSIGRPFLAPPEVPADRVAALRSAFMATMQDAEFIAEARRQQLELRPLSGERLAAIVADTLATPPAMLARVKALMEAGDQPRAQGTPAQETPAEGRTPAQGRN